jgi:methyl-accepting chemotaxis protein
MEIQRNSSSVWPYVILGSAIGGAVGYLFVTEAGRKIRRSITHPDELAGNVEQAGNFIERKARVVTDRVHDIISKARLSIEEGELAYREAGQQYRTQARQIENKNNQVASSVHNAVDRMSRSAAAVEQSILDPICELGALYRGVERGIRMLMGKAGERTFHEGPIPIHRDHRVMGS